MIGLIQRVTNAKVVVDEITVGEINQGVLLLLGVEKDDDKTNAEKLLEKVINFRIFEDTDQKMNLSLLDIQGELLIVPQFTLAASTQKGTRPSFASAASPAAAELLFDEFCNLSKNKLQKVSVGLFGANMKVSLTNDGPATFWLHK